MKLKEKILQKLRGIKGFLSRESLARKLNVSSMTVGRLKVRAYVIEAMNRMGYRLKGLNDDVLTPLKIQHKLGTELVGWKIYCLKEVENTMEEAKRLAGEKEGLTVIAERQIKGRGRLQRGWHSPYGGIYLSVLLKPRLNPSTIPCLSLMGSLATAETIKELYGIDVKLKWPNDVVWRDRKLCGILLESFIESDIIHYVILGLGVNLNVSSEDFPPDLRCRAVSIRDILGKEVSRLGFIKELLRNLDRWYVTFLEKGGKPIVEEWSKLSTTLGRRVKVFLYGETLEGEAEALDETGALILKLTNGLKKIILSGEVQHLKET